MSEITLTVKPPTITGEISTPYYVRGRRPELLPYMDQLCSDILGAIISEALIGMFLYNAPDGLIIEHRGIWYEVKDRQLMAIDPYKPGKMLTEKRKTRIPDPTVKELEDEIKQAGYELAWMLAHDKGLV